ncbi:MAG: hypothetical protein M1821_009256 [Bathelium mastoideum]|nr:MAG: hypothetical protein M1821_009256 [Bathelium mastoideum]
MRASLREAAASTQEHQNEDKPGRFWSLFKNWGSPCGKASPDIQHSIDAKPKTDGYSVNMKLSMTAKLHYNAAGQMIAREVDSSESHSVKRKPVHASGKRYGADKVLNLPCLALGQAGGAEWDWESPTTIPKYASTYNPGNLKRRNALHRASASARASVANIRKKDSVGGPGFERHDSASVLNDDVSDAVLRSRNSWDENSEYFTASAHSSLELNRASGSSLRELLPNASSGAEASATNAGDTLIAPLNSSKRPQRTYSWESSEESLSTSFDLPMMGTDRNIRFRQEAPDCGLHLELRWEEEEEDQRRQEQSSTKTCIICTDDLHVLDFQVKPPTARCNHPVETCQNCVQQWIASEFESNGWEHIKCPQCLELLDHADMQAAADPDLFARYDTLTTRAHLSHEPLFYWCIASGCPSGQIHLPEGGPAFTCTACEFQHCVTHMIPWHSGETCAQYDYRVSGQQQRDEERKQRERDEEASRKLMETTTKRCPGPKGKKCGWGIEKSEGCDHMTCRKCRGQYGAYIELQVSFK